VFGVGIDGGDIGAYFPFVTCTLFQLALLLALGGLDLLLGYADDDEEKNRLKVTPIHIRHAHMLWGCYRELPLTPYTRHLIRAHALSVYSIQTIRISPSNGDRKRKIILQFITSTCPTSNHERTKQSALHLTLAKKKQ
jgi:hypothetical protein